MILECPHCSARLNAAAMPAPGKPVRCSKCKEVFYPLPPQAPAQESSNQDDWSNVASSPVSPVKEEPEEREKQEKSSRKAKKPEGKFPVLLVVSGVFALFMVVVTVLAFLFIGGDKPSSNNSSTANQNQPQAKKENPPKKDNQKADVNTVKLQIPPEYADVFKESAEQAAPIVLVPTLKKTGVEGMKLPIFASKIDADPEAGKLTLEELKKATTFIKVRRGDSGGTGSGFVIRADREGILVATNYHVINLKLAGQLLPDTKITVVFDSGLKTTQRELRAEVIAADSEVDLAIVKVAAFDPLPKGIDVNLSPKLMETMAVRGFGFPLGQRLGVDGQNPNVSVGSGTVSSLRLNAAGEVSKVQINGASLVPGNSGGPVVDNDGKLVGIAVSWIPGTGIAHAVPATKLAEMLLGRVSAPTVTTVGQEEGLTSYQADVGVSDPLHKIKDIFVHVWMGDITPQVEKEENGNWKVLPETTKVPLKRGLRSASGRFKLPSAPPGKVAKVLVQLEIVNESGPVSVSSPVAYKIVMDQVQTAADAIPLARFSRDLSKYYGQVVAVRGKLSPGSIKQGAVYELQVADDSNANPTGLVFLVDRELGTQLNERPATDVAEEVRLTCRVGKEGKNATTPVRISRIDFIGQDNRLDSSLPSKQEPVDKLIALNRKPENYEGKIVEFEGWLSPAILGSDKDPELSILMKTQKRPENIHFTCPNSILSQLKGPGYSNDELYAAHFTVRVEPRLLDTGARIVTVTKIEFVDADGKPGKTLE